MTPKPQDRKTVASAHIAGTVVRARGLPRNKKTGAGGGYRVTVRTTQWMASDGRGHPADPVEVFVRPPLVSPYCGEPAVGSIVAFEVEIWEGGEQSPTCVASRLAPLDF
jgi:hypothetical protein